MSDLPTAEEMLAGVKHRPPSKDWMDVPTEIRKGIACVRHQNMSGSDIGDDHKEYFAGDAALKAAGEHNTMNQFS